MPSTANSIARRYLLVTELMLAWRADLHNGSPAACVRDGLLSPSGQHVVAESGYIPVAHTYSLHERRGIH